MDLQKIKEYAISCHESTNHRYGNDEPYSVHLQMVVDTALRFIDIIPEDIVGLRDNIVAAAWCHDVIEDCRQTYNDVLQATGSKHVANLVYALTNEKGRNRAERGNEKYYNGIIEEPYAIFIKLCDRIANVSYSKMHGSRMFEMYKGENDEFMSKLLPISMLTHRYITMVNFLERDLFELSLNGKNIL